MALVNRLILPMLRLLTTVLWSHTETVDVSPRLAIGEFVALADELHENLPDEPLGVEFGDPQHRVALSCAAVGILEQSAVMLVLAMPLQSG